MDRRRKILGVALGVAGALSLGRWAWATYVSGPLGVQQRSLETAEKKLAATNAKLVAARYAQTQLDELASLSLPGNPSAAQEKYQAYLIELLQSARVANPAITPGQPSLRDGVYFVPFSVQADTDLVALTRFLHSFYLAPRMQQIRRLSLNPIDREDKGPGIRFSLLIEALALGDAEVADANPSLVEPRVETSPEAYAAVVDRNVLFTNGPVGMALPANAPEHVVLTAIVHQGERAEADVYDRASNTTRRIRRGDACNVGSVTATVLDLGLRDVVVLIGPDLWQWNLGTSFSARTKLSAEQALDREVRKKNRANETNQRAIANRQSRD